MLVEVNSLWILMEVKSGKPARLPEKMKEVYVTEPALERDWGDRKRKQDEQAQEAYRFVVQGMHIDTNGHMNNEKYVAAAQECLPEGLRHPTSMWSTKNLPCAGMRLSA